jgi:hypothetical protein
MSAATSTPHVCLQGVESENFYFTLIMLKPEPELQKHTWRHLRLKTLLNSILQQPSIRAIEENICTGKEEKKTG